MEYVNPFASLRLLRKQKGRRLYAWLKRPMHLEDKEMEDTLSSHSQMEPRNAKKTKNEKVIRGEYENKIE